MLIKAIRLHPRPPQSVTVADIVAVVGMRVVVVDMADVVILVGKVIVAAIVPLQV